MPKFRIFPYGAEPYDVQADRVCQVVENLKPIGVGKGHLRKRQVEAWLRDMNYKKYGIEDLARAAKRTGIYSPKTVIVDIVRMLTVHIERMEVQRGKPTSSTKK